MAKRTRPTFLPRRSWMNSLALACERSAFAPGRARRLLRSPPPSTPRSAVGRRSTSGPRAFLPSAPPRRPVRTCRAHLYIRHGGGKFLSGGNRGLPRPRAVGRTQRRSAARIARVGRGADDRPGPPLRNARALVCRDRCTRRRPAHVASTRVKWAAGRSPKPVAHQRVPSTSICQFRDPLAPTSTASASEISASSRGGQVLHPRYVGGTQAPRLEDLERLVEIANSCERGVIACGPMDAEPEFCAALAGSRVGAGLADPRGSDLAAAIRRAQPRVRPSWEIRICFCGMSGSPAHSSPKSCCVSAEPQPVNPSDSGSRGTCRST